MKLQLASRVKRVKPSATLTVTSRAAQLKAAGRHIIGLGAGEPDFDTPDHIKEAAIRAIHEGRTKYTAVAGTPGLKQAIVDKFARENSLEYTPEQVLVSAGGKQSFYNLAQALLNPGDEVLIPAPYWVSYPDMVLLAGGEPVILKTTQEQGFKITPAQLEGTLSANSRMLVLNSPANPTGTAYNQDELEALAEVLLRHPNLLIATDDMYEHILWGDHAFTNILNACPELYDRTIVLNGVSKAYAMTGWRIGYAAGPQELIQAMTTVQSQSTSCPCSISQAAAQAALDGDQACIQPMVKAFRQRHELVVERLNAMPGVQCRPCDGTFYCFPRVADAIEATPDVQNDVEFAEHLLNTAEVALVPGSAFGAPGHVRISFATSMDKLRQALDRLDKALQPS